MGKSRHSVSPSARMLYKLNRLEAHYQAQTHDVKKNQQVKHMWNKTTRPQVSPAAMKNSSVYSCSSHHATKLPESLNTFVLGLDESVSCSQTPEACKSEARRGERRAVCFEEPCC
ncbi:hypothetical protein Q7C36_022403 [Tachysurus vachellii]|uniref:Uncharacterized protein n=1 Tax=Tachysurus vachellii TaxID=175792 RepID=A0AA88IGQ8_TACVA|nr:hypothetical protein Q7C36_022403 [Tachysurus vachellii]